jgi:ribosomal protein S27AE
MIENLENIRKLGINNFITKEKERWRCAKCNGTINVHRGYCSNCGEKSKGLL